MTIAQGWLLDCYPALSDAGGLTFWLKSDNGESVRLRDTKWHARIYAAGSACDSPEFTFSRLRDSGFVSSVNMVKKRTSVFDRRKNDALEIELRRADRAKNVANLLESFFQNPSTFRLYNVDVTPEQQYFLENNLFPLARVRVHTNGDEITRWRVLDSTEATEYEIPKLKVMSLDVSLVDLVSHIDSKLNSITLTPSIYQEEAEQEKIIIQGSEETILTEAASEVQKFDPDFIITSNGDAFVFPYLYSKAQFHRVSFDLNRDSEATKIVHNTRTGGKTYFSYGRIMYRPATQRFYGRIHVDGQNTFVYDRCRFEGLFEISRISRMPFHTSSRASIGKSLSGLQFYHAYQRGLLIPYKPVVSEDVKSMDDLLVADRGGLVFVPLLGIHERVCEFDFASLYPNIIKCRNISAETINCTCCPNSTNRLDDLNVHICEKKRGLVAESLHLPLWKRSEYKRLREETNDPKLKRIYSERATALKWVLVCCFGYLSYRNAKFGKIDSHIAVCSIARRTLLDAMHTAESRGYSIIHGIVDSLWVFKDRAKLSDYEELGEEIERATTFKISIEGIYKWIVFLPSKIDSQTLVPSRYFGTFEKNNELKVRGIEWRRCDAPLYIKACQRKILEELAKCNNESELRACARSEGISIFNEFVRNLERHDVPPLSLLINRKLSKNLSEYHSKRQLSVNAAFKLKERGLELKAGQSVSYVITKFRTSGTNRATPEELSRNMEYDCQRYVELLADSCATILSPFGVTREVLLSRSETLPV